jgi:outer membrane receptor protein involved in Fe transport
MTMHKRQRHAWRLAVLVTTVFSLLPLNTHPTVTLAAAQTNRATVSGRITDEQGNVVSKAKVVATNLDTGIRREGATDEEGRYRLVELLPGRYEISVERQGFRPVAQRGVELTVGRAASADFTLKVGKVEEAVIIEQDAPLVEMNNSAMGRLVNGRQLQDLPLNGRDVFQLATMENGVISASSITGPQSDLGPGTTRLTINGGRLDFNAFLLDGTETSDAFGYSPGGFGGGFLGVDALREFQILTSGYSAEYGHGGGAIINAVTKSGTNQVHGSAFEFLRNSALDARNYFDKSPRKLPFQRNQFGGSLGGPIIKDRAFLFGSYEGLRRREGVPTLFFVPSLDARQGLLVDPNDPSKKTQITIAPSVLPYLALYPLPNGAVSGDTGIYLRNFKEKAQEDFATLRADYKLTRTQSLSGRYTGDISNLTKVGGAIQDLKLYNTNQYISLEEQAIINTRGVNSLRFSYSRSNFRNNYNFVVPVDPGLGFIPGRQMGAITLSGVSSLRETLSDDRKFTLNQFELNDQFIYSLGAHSIKIGGSIRRYQLNADSTIVRDGLFIFSGGLDLFLTASPGALFTTVPGTDSYRGIRQSLFGLYAQDDWKLTRRLTLNLGLRYEPASTPTAVNGKVANLRNVFTDAAPTVGNPFINNPSLKNIAPRVGFALDVSGDGKTSLRGAAGVFHSAILPMRYRFEMSNQGPFARLGIAVGPFPNAFTSPGSLLPGGLVSPMAFNADQPKVYQWNLNIQRELGRDLVLDVGYVGSRGVNLESRSEIDARTDFQIVNGRKFFPAGDGPTLSQNFSSVNYFDFNADSYYHGLQLNLSKRFSGGLQFQTAYTLSKSIDTASSMESVFLNGASGNFRQDPSDTRAERALSDFDVRHNFVANFLYDLPFGKGRRFSGNLRGAADALIATLIGGWSAGGIVNLKSGFPFNVSLGFNRARNGIQAVQVQRPDVVPGVDLSDAIVGDPSGFVNPDFFQLQPAGFYGNAPRNGLRGPDLRSFDMTLIKRTQITERVRTEFRFEAFNLFNRPNFAPPEAVNRTIYTGVDSDTGAQILNPTFGQLTRTSTTSRQLQFGLKLIW